VSVADEEPQLGDTVVAVGAPLGLSHTVTEGIVSATDRPVLAGETEADATVTAAIQTDASINPGNSGGPLFNAAGQLVGVNTSIYTFVNSNEEGGSIGLGFAISSGQAVRVAESIIDNRGVPERTELGAEFDTTPVKELGATVKSVDNDAPAAEAGLEEGDLVTEFNGEKVLDEVHLAALVLKASPEDKVTVAYERGGDAEEVDVTLSASPDD
ncbi:MAG: S1C family serine protease, partial [Stackebrandtia sp.]